MTDRYYHRTNNLDNIASSGKIMALKHLARSMPELLLEVEPGAGGSNVGGLVSNRSTMSASDAYEAMRGVKDVDNVFLTKDVVAPEAYGKYVIKKDLRSPSFNSKLNLIPNEYKTPRSLSVRSNASVYVPEEEMDELKEKYKHLDIRRMEDLDARSASLTDRARTLYSKILSPNATIVGSEGIGIDIGGKSDRDILVAYKTRKAYDNMVNKLEENNFGLQESAYNKHKRDGYKVYSYKDGNHDIDVALVHGGKAPDLANHTRELRSTMSDEDRERIRTRKSELSNSWILPNLRYKRYKKSIDKELGLTKFHER